MRMDAFTFRRKKLRNVLFKQNHDNFYAEHFEYKKTFELLR